MACLITCFFPTVSVSIIWYLTSPAFLFSFWSMGMFKFIQVHLLNYECCACKIQMDTYSICRIIAVYNSSQSLGRHYLDWQMKKLKKIIRTLLLSWAARACQLIVSEDTFLKIGQHENYEAICPYKPEIHRCKQIFMFMSHISIIKHGSLICGWSIQYYLCIAYVFKSPV